ncbi:DNA topoisomerase 3-alpha [Arabidopsis thaliana]|uniref:DNA topoisomerase n=2 Tax=Arabidopsis TaxID=3701 RepID=A0A178UN49_ARATH|nr:TOPRIM domain [Arabidopsis thaliana x Arabidopsis arenosa]OAO94111.1 TOP3A [Arabidopsis thaliana]
MSRRGGGPVTVLNVAEKPSVAKSVAGILSRGTFRTREGRSRYNKIFEFDYAINGQPCRMLMTSVIGHLMELEFADRYRKWHSCDPADLYQAPVMKHVPEDKKDIKKTLEEEARKSDWLVLWLDCDREGENIAFEVVDVCRAVKHNLFIRRAHFSALIDRDIHEAVQNLRDPNQLFAEAVDARQEIDLRIGASFTRFQTMLLRDRFAIDSTGEERSRVISYGPCQFPTLGFIVERYWEIQAHEPEEFWTINCSHQSEEGLATFNWMRGHLFDYASAVILYEMCVEEPTATVMNVPHPRERFKYPPYPLNTIELEKRASRYFRLSSEHTMKVAEELYQAGFISYPRTETDSFSSRTDLRAMVEEQTRHPAWGSYAQRLLEPEGGLWRNPANGGHDDKAHPPIHPTKFSSGESNWSRDHLNVYELVVRHYLACVSQPAVAAETTVEIDIAGERFSASGRAILAKNYLEVYRFESWGGSVIPVYEKGQQFIPTTLTLDAAVTRPPPLLCEADLLSCMDKAGIGTDATMHDHIKKLLDRGYATKDANTRFSPTNLGEALVMGYDDMGYELWKPNLRALMEHDMNEVSVGRKTKAEVLETCLQQMKACFLDARVKKSKLLEAMTIFFERSNNTDESESQTAGEVVRRCNLCNESDMALRKNRDGNFMVGCMNYPQCRNAVWLPGPTLEASVTTNVCQSCGPGPVYKILFKFRQIGIPPGFDVNHLGCVGGCDDILKQLIDICGTGSRSQARRTPGTAPSNNIQGSNTRQSNVCIHCQQRGHASTNCPSRVPASQNSRPTATNPRNDESTVSCNTCGSQCVLRTANTEANRGRQFFSCPTQGCSFFAWEDSINNSSGNATTGSNSGGSGRRGSRGRGRGGRGGQSSGGRRGSGTSFVSATGEPVSGIRCFSCGDPSHFANACPNRNTSNGNYF